MDTRIFKRWTSAVAYLNNKINQSRIIPGRNVKLEDTGNGIRIHNSLEIPAEVYTGYFKVIRPADAKIKIVDGKDIEADNCFSGCINKLKKDIPATEVTITQTGVVYLEIIPVYTGDVATGWTCTFKHAASMPDYEDKKAFILISRLTFADGKITAFNRENVALPLTVRGAC